VKKCTVSFFLGIVNKGEAHSDAGCLSNTPSLHLFGDGVFMYVIYWESLAVIQRYALPQLKGDWLGFPVT
jgi:hypothetical protein